MASSGVEESTHTIKLIEDFGRITPIILQDKNGSCPLVAICNFLLLKKKLVLDANISEISQKVLLSYVGDQLIDSKKDKQSINHAIDLLPCLTTGIDVNMTLTSISEFEPTKQLAIFDLLEIPLYHGWIVDPQDSDTYNAVGSKYYDAIMLDLARLDTGTGDSEDKKKAEKDSVAAKTAAFGVPSPGLSSSSGFISQQKKAGRGDIEEQDELRRVVKISEADFQNPSKDVSLDSCDACDVASKNEITPQQGKLIGNFVNTNSSQLTVHGLVCLQKQLREQELCVFFRNNHFSTMFKFEGRLYLLVADQGYHDQPNLVWSLLNEVSGNSVFMTGRFKEFKKDVHVNDTWDEENARASTVIMTRAFKELKTEDDHVNDTWDEQNARAITAVKKNNRWRLSRMVVRARLMNLMVKTIIAYKPNFENVRILFIPEKLHGCYAVQIDNYKFPVKQQLENCNYFLHVEESSKNLEEWITKYKPMEFVFKATKFERKVPTENSKQLVKMIIIEFWKMVNRDEEHYDLYSLRNYRIQMEGIGPKVVGVSIIHDHTSTRKTSNIEERVEALIHIIFKEIFGDQNNLIEWGDLKRILQESAKDVKLLHSAKKHVCFWNYKQRLLMFVDLTISVDGESEVRRSKVEDAVVLCPTLMSEWETIVRAYAPLVCVLDYHFEESRLKKSEDDSHSTNSRKWRHGHRLIRFLRHCYSHLTCWYWDCSLARKRIQVFDNVKEGDDPEFRTLPFLNHIITYFLFPTIFIELQAALGVDFKFMHVED